MDLGDRCEGDDQCTGLNYADPFNLHYPYHSQNFPPLPPPSPLFPPSVTHVPGASGFCDFTSYQCANKRPVYTVDSNKIDDIAAHDETQVVNGALILFPGNPPSNQCDRDGMCVNGMCKYVHDRYVCCRVNANNFDHCAKYSQSIGDYCKISGSITDWDDYCASGLCSNHVCVENPALSQALGNLQRMSIAFREEKTILREITHASQENVGG